MQELKARFLLVEVDLLLARTALSQGKVPHDEIQTALDRLGAVVDQRAEYLGLGEPWGLQTLYRQYVLTGELYLLDAECALRKKERPDGPLSLARLELTRALAIDSRATRARALRGVVLSRLAQLETRRDSRMELLELSRQDLMAGILISGFQKPEFGPELRQVLDRIAAQSR